MDLEIWGFEDLGIWGFGDLGIWGFGDLGLIPCKVKWSLRQLVSLTVYGEIFFGFKMCFKFTV